jgi:thiamine pyrophosphokinase
MEGFILRAVVFANGDLPPLTELRAEIQAGDLVVAADAGARPCLALGITPHLVIGDFDSLSEPELAELEARGSEILRFPPEKDFTDLDLALMAARERGATLAVIYGGLGRRWDQTLANLAFCTAPHLRGLRLRFVDGPQVLWTLAAGETTPIEGQPGDIVSLLPLCGDARGVWTEGLAYPLHGDALAAGATRGVSNKLIGRSATVRLETGSLMIIHIHQEELSPHGP